MIKRLIIFALCGALCGLSFPDYDIHYLIWIVLAPCLLLCIQGLQATSVLICGIVFGYVWAVVDLYWLVYVFGLFSGGLWLIHSMFYMFFFVLFTLASKRLGYSKALLFAPFLWVSIEFFRCELWLLKFPWLSLGHSQHANLALIQICSIVGMYGLSFVIIVVNCCFAFLLKGWPRPRAFIPLLLVIFFVIGTHFYGWIKLKQPISAGHAIQIAGIETEVEALSTVIERVDNVLRQYKEASLIILPEYTFMSKLTNESKVMKDLVQLARENSRTIIFGAKRPLDNLKPLSDFASCTFVISVDGKLIHTQDKSVPVPLMIDGQPATRLEPFILNSICIGIGICYDMGFTFVSRKLVNRGAQILIFPSMDMYGWGRAQHYQHASLAKFRAVENHRYLARVASSGISMIVDPYGRIVIQTDYSKDRKILYGVLYASSQSTFFVRYGYLFPYACMLVTILFCAACLYRQGIIRSFFPLNK